METAKTQAQAAGKCTQRHRSQCGSVDRGVILQTKRLPVPFPVGAHAWVAGLIPRLRCV